MKSSTVVLWCASSILAASGLTFAQNAKPADYSFTTHETWAVPQAELTPGKYTISVRDRLLDRAIFQVRDAKTNQVSTTFLAVPAHGVTAGGPFTFFSNANGTKYVKTWRPANQDETWQLVYPKEKAVQLATDNHVSVAAVDLGAAGTGSNPYLSDRDMQSIQLWMLTPKMVNGGVQMAAAKMGRGHGTATQTVASAAPASSNTSAAEPAAETHAMPHTATDAGNSIAVGTLLVLMGSFLALLNRQMAVIKKTR